MDIIDNKTDKELLDSLIAEVAKGNNEVKCARNNLESAKNDLEKVSNRLAFSAMLINTLRDRTNNR